MKILGLLAETPLHPGAGSSAGVIDLPVARESTTDYPVIAGSSMKGALLDRAERAQLNHRELFGSQDAAGQILISDARLLLLPVRTLSGGPYRWATCPYLLERFRRDWKRAGHEVPWDVPEVAKGKALGQGTGTLYLEERQFEWAGAVPAGIVQAIRGLIAHSETAARVDRLLTVLHDEDFAWFARYGLSVNARNVLTPEKQSENLWYEETLPPDCLFYCLLSERRTGALTEVLSIFDEHPYLQIGGNETVGQGWLAVKREG